MREKHYKREFAIAQTVADMKRQFVYPDLDTKPPPPPFIGTGSGGAPTVVVAASNALPISKSKADFVCNGVNDQDVLQAAANALTIPRGRLLLTEGDFLLTGPVALNGQTHLQGMGVSSEITVNRDDPGWSGATEVIGMASSRCIASHLSFGMSGEISGTHDIPMLRTHDDCLVHDVQIRTGSASGITYDMILDGADNIVHGIWLGDASLLVDHNDHQVRGVVIDGAGAVVVTAVDAVIDGMVSSSPVPWMVDASGADRCVVTNIASSVAGGIRVQDTDGFIISNYSYDANGATDYGVLASGCTEVVISASHIEDADLYGIRLVDSDRCVVEGVYLEGNPTANLALSGTSSENLITGIKSFGGFPVTNFGLSVEDATCNCNIVVGNALGDPANYGSDALNDAGTNTQLTYPNDATYGDNFTACGSPTSP